MTLTLDEIVFRTRALAQAHPLSPGAQAYLKSVVADQQEQQPAPEIGIWAGYALTVGYCLRRVEESDTDSEMVVEERWAQDLDELSTDIGDRIRSERAAGLLLYPEPLVVSALDRVIAGEIDRRLSHGSDVIDQETFSKLEAYLAWWTIKGYSLRIAEQFQAEGAVT